MTTLTQDIQAKEEELSSRLGEMREEALNRFSQIVGRESTLQQMHAHVGRNNNTFVDSTRMQFHSPEDFIARWFNGLTQQVIERKDAIARRRRFGNRKRTEEIIPEMLQDQFLHNYIHLFLERNFYRNFEARVRAKPDQNLWQVWFGSGQLVWGLLISPSHRFGEWTNDKIQMRRENYSYWTVEHVLETDLIAPESEKPVIQISFLKKFPRGRPRSTGGLIPRNEFKVRPRGLLVKTSQPHRFYLQVTSSLASRYCLRPQMNRENFSITIPMLLSRKYFSRRISLEPELGKTERINRLKSLLKSLTKEENTLSRS
jgi:hypothetical protein